MTNDLNHDAIFGTRNDFLQIENILDEIEKEFNLPTLGIKAINQIGCEFDISNIGDIKSPLFFMHKTNKTNGLFHKRYSCMGIRHGG